MDRQDTTASGLRRISEMSGYKVSDEDPDIRGWDVIGPDGTVIGEVDDLLVDTTQMKVRSIDVDVKGADHTFVPADRVQVDRQNKKVHIQGMAAQPGAGTRSQRDITSGQGPAEGTAQRMTRSEEELRVGTRQVQGDYVVGKHVETDRVEREVTLHHEEPVIERRPVAEGTRADSQEIGSAEVRVPLVHEEAIVEKRPVVKEEIVVGKRIVEEQAQVEADVRREELDVDNTSGRPGARGRREE